MNNDSNGSTQAVDEPEFNLPAPRFDERATAKAQPVQPISPSRVSSWRNTIGSMRRAISDSSKALALVVVAGLVTGTLGGMAWVKERQVTDPPSVNESVSELAASDSQIDSRNEEPRAAVFGVTNLQSPKLTTRIRKSRLRVRSSRVPHAYRVAVLR
jgi:hypothetical protein